jgi:hypothetical protein
MVGLVADQSGSLEGVFLVAVGFPPFGVSATVGTERVRIAAREGDDGEQRVRGGLGQDRVLGRAGDGLVLVGGELVEPGTDAVAVDRVVAYGERSAEVGVGPGVLGRCSDPGEWPAERRCDRDVLHWALGGCWGGQYGERVGSDTGGWGGGGGVAAVAEDVIEGGYEVGGMHGQALGKLDDDVGGQLVQVGQFGPVQRVRMQAEQVS